MRCPETALARRHDARHQPTSDRRTCGHYHASAPLLADLADIAQRVVEVRQQTRHARQQSAAHIGELYLARGAIDRLEADFALEFAHTAAHRRLRQADFIAGAAEALQARDLDENPELTQRLIHLTVLINSVI